MTQRVTVPHWPEPFSRTSPQRARLVGLGAGAPASVEAPQPGGVRNWCRKGTAHRFEYTPGIAPQTLVRAAVRALALASPEAREYWPSQVDQVTEQDMTSIIERLPEMSEVARTFAIEVLLVNRKRVLDACA